MEATSTIDMRPATSSEMRAYTRHVAHDPNETHANKMIVESDRELNRYHVINDEGTALNDQYKNYIDSRNAKLERDFNENKISLEQYTSRKQSVREYVNGSNGSKEKKAYTSAVLTVADVDTQQDMLDKLGWSYKMIGVGKPDANGKYEHYRAQLTDKGQRETWAQLWDMTYTQTAKDISNESLRAISVMTNLDEGGGAHAHVGFVNMGHTDKGKPSTTLNGALKAMYGYKDSRANLRQFRETYDPIMIANFNKSAEALGLDLQLDMIRTREAGSVDMPTYKVNKKKEAELKQYEDVLKGRKKRLDKRDQEVDKKNQEADRKNQEALKKQQELAGQQELIRLTQRSNERTKRKLEEWEKKVKEKEERQAKIDEQQAKTEERQNEREDRLNNIWNKVQAQADSIKNFVKRTVSMFNLGEKFQNNIANQTILYPVPREKGGLTKEKYTGGNWALTAIHENPKRFTPNVVKDLTKQNKNTKNKKKEKDDELEL
ncbi:MAG: hypothetical protein ABF777_10665 [Liquorilactobacillus satsumensis]|uniref:hypothetical protein n=1 Tax=Liquorilactobacillus satsumensis TaxID=259059 RepID=UPI0039E77F62